MKIDSAAGIIELKLREADDRVYTITITATDEVGNSSAAVLTVLVVDG